MTLTKHYLLELQGCMLNLGYEDVELDYLSSDGRHATLRALYEESHAPSDIGLFAGEASGVSIWVDGKAAGTMSKNWGQLPDPKDLANHIWMNDPCARQRFIISFTKTNA